MRAIWHAPTAVHAVDTFRATVALHRVATRHRGALASRTRHIALTTRAFLAYVENVKEVLSVTVTLTWYETAVAGGATVALGGVRAGGRGAEESFTRDRPWLTHAGHAWVGRAGEARLVFSQCAGMEAVCGKEKEVTVIFRWLNSMMQARMHVRANMHAIMKTPTHVHPYDRRPILQASIHVNNFSELYYFIKIRHHCQASRLKVPLVSSHNNKYWADCKQLTCLIYCLHLHQQHTCKLHILFLVYLLNTPFSFLCYKKVHTDNKGRR